MSVLRDAPTYEGRALSQVLAVTLRPSGLSVPNLDDHVAIPLDLPRLELIGQLGSGKSIADVILRIAEQFGCDQDSLVDFVGELHARDLLIAQERAPHPWSTEPSTTIPTPVETNIPPGALLVVETPAIFWATSGAFVHVALRGGAVVPLTPVEVLACAACKRPATREQAFDTHRDDAGRWALSSDQFGHLAGRLLSIGLLRTFDPDDPDDVPASERGQRLFVTAFRARHQLLRNISERGDAAPEDLAVDAPAGNVKVVPVAFNGTIPPLALGLILANSSIYEGGRLNDYYDLRPDWVVDHRQLDHLLDRPGVFLLSNYLWSHTDCLAVSRRVKERHPGSITIHGGPNTPKYDEDIEDYFRRHPHVDVTVRGEGEATATEVLAALVGSIGDADPDLSALADVPGISYRARRKVVRTPDRDRISDLDSIPSPYLNGLFDSYAALPDLAVTIETNRGCPYGCTFCDWGSATLSRIRKFSLDRVFEEMEWCAKNGVFSIGLADANFGIWERDVEIAERVVQLNAQYGYPKVFGANYAKNTTKHLKKIIELLVDGGVLTQGALSLQTMDEMTLSTIKRSNIKLSKYEELAVEFRRAQLPLIVELMMGLPGATTASFRNDLQQCIDREVRARVPITELLVNSPMNEPAYRREHQITADTIDSGNRSLVVSTATYTRDEHAEMKQLRQMFYLFENFGVLRQVARYVRHETGILEIDLYERLRRDLLATPDQWPIMTFTIRAVPFLMVAPGSWAQMLKEIHDYVTNVVGVADDSALRTVLDVQLALLPDRSRQFPDNLSLSHDFAAWHRELVTQKDGGHRDDWPALVPPLRSFPPATLTVDDPRNVCLQGLGHNIEYELGDSWELASPVNRAAMYRSVN
ncbi:MAG: B12-binding domain-containing radical SAM protein [Actinobacteria bacterium]|nr:B12-binding domain-containing radical SAM protein [Actinomycetota bacterium]